MSRRASHARAIRELADEHGLEVEPTNGGHLRVSDPRSGRFFFAASTPSDPHALRYVRADIKRLLRNHHAKATR